MFNCRNGRVRTHNLSLITWEGLSDVWLLREIRRPFCLHLFLWFLRICMLLWLLLFVRLIFNYFLIRIGTTCFTALFCASSFFVLLYHFFVSSVYCFFCWVICDFDVWQSEKKKLKMKRNTDQRKTTIPSKKKTGTLGRNILLLLLLFLTLLLCCSYWRRIDDWDGPFKVTHRKGKG